MNDRKDFILKFINEELNGNIEELKSFPFENLKNDSVYRKTTDGSYHIDDSEIVRSVFFLVWENLLPGLDEYNNIGTGKKYRGDTLNTFNTLFGKEEHSYFRLRKYCDDIPIQEEVLNVFRKTYLTIGNLTLLPCIKGTPNSEIKPQTINYYRGNYFRWRDYFDKFLLELDRCLTNSPMSDKTLASIVRKNDFYFSSIDTIEKFKATNFLESYFDINNKNLLIFGKESDSWKYSRNPTKRDRLEYKEFSKHYVSKATEIINYRADKIVNALKLKLI